MFDFRKRLARRAIVLEIGGVKPPDNHLSSWFGCVNICAPGELWPMMEGKPMHPLCQINLSELPFHPPHLEDVEMLTIFIGPEELPIDAPNGQNWCLRTYQSTSSLIPLPQQATRSGIKPFPMRPHVEEEDFPCWDDVTFDIPKQIAEI